MQPKISVIIPCWKITPYIDRLYQNIQSQTFKDFELILVNDGNASQNEALQTIAEKDSRIRVIWKENGGTSSARNVGIDNARGEWIVFNDDDDDIKPYYLESLYSAVKDSDSDLAVGGYTEYKLKQNLYRQDFINIEGDMEVAMDTKSALIKILDSVVSVFNWNKIYKASIIKENNLRFDVKAKVIQDGPFNMDYYLHCKKISLVKDCGYIYYINDATNQISSYDPTYGDEALKLLSKYNYLLDTLKLGEEKTDKLRTQKAFGLSIVIIFNAFRHNHPSFKQAKAEIRKYVLQNEQMMDAVKKYRKQKYISKMEKFMAYAISTKSATFIAVMIKLMFWLRYKSPKFYTKIRSLIYRNR